MICYRSIINNGGSAEDSLSYTATVNGIAQPTSCANLFQAQYTFNERVVIGNNVENCAFMLQGCNNFNQPVTFGKRIKNYYGMFAACEKFNQPITFSEYAYDCRVMLSGCASFNRPITIPNTVQSCYLMFSDCTSYNQDIIIPSNVIHIAEMFKYANGTFNIYINGSPTGINSKNMLGGKNNLKRINIFANGFGHLEYTNSESVIGQYIGWSYDTNCIYNTTYNIYIYNNYVGT